MLDIPNHWTPRQAMAVYEFLADLQQQIWDRYEKPLVEIIIADLDYQQPVETDHSDFDDNIPF